MLLPTKRWLSRLGWAVLLLMLAYFWISFWLIKVIPQHRLGIEYWLTQRLATEVRIGDIQVSGQGLTPNIALQNIQLLASRALPNSEELTSDTVFSIASCYLGIDVWASLWHQQLRLRFLQLKGVNASVFQTKQGDWQLQGAEVLQNSLRRHNQQTPISAVLQPTSKQNALSKQNSFLSAGSIRGQRSQEFLRWLDALIEQRGLLVEDVQLTLTAQEHLTQGPLSADALSAVPLPTWWKLLQSTQPALPSPQSSQQTLSLRRLTLYKQAQQYVLFSQLNAAPTDLTPQLTLSARIQGESFEPQTWQAQAYIRLTQKNLTPWLSFIPASQLPAGLVMDHVQGEMEAWLDLASGDLQRLRGRLSLEDLRWRYQWHPYRLDQLQTELEWQYQDRKHWSLHVAPSNWQVAKQYWRLPAWQVSQLDQPNSNTPDSSTSVVQVRTDTLDIQPLHQLLNAMARFDWLGSELITPTEEVWFHPPARRSFSWQTGLQKLVRMSPSGQIQNLVWQQTQQSSKPQNWQADFNQLSWQTLNWLPGITGLQGHVKGESRSGTESYSAPQLFGQVTVQTQSPQVVLNWPKVFAEPLPDMRLQGQVVLNWQTRLSPLQQGPDWQLQFQQFEAVNKDAIAQAQARVTKTSYEAPLLTLQAQVRHASASAVAHYLPTHIMAAPLVDWLKQSVLAGNLPQADFLYQGRLQRTSDALAKSLLMRFQVADATLDYLPPWPQLNQANAEVLVLNKQVQVSLHNANIMGAQILPSRLSIQEQQGDWRLQLDAKAEGDAQTGMAVLAQSPLQTSLAGLLSAVKLQGPIKTQLLLNTSLNPADKNTANKAGSKDSGPKTATTSNSQKSDKYKNQQPNLIATVITDFNGLTVDMPLWKLTAQKLQGQLRYDTEQGISVLNWQGQFFNQTIKGSTRTQNLPSGQAIVSEFSGSMPLAEFKAWLQQPLLQFATGNASYQSKLVLTPWQQMRGSFLQVSSDLLGVQVALPAPYGLNGKQALAFNYRQLLDGQGLNLDVRYGRDLRVLRQADNLHIHWGDGPLIQGKGQLDTGVVLTGELPAVDVKPWVEVLSRAAAEPANNTVANPSVAQSSPQRSWSDWILSLSKLNLSLANLRWQDQELGRTQLQVQPSEQNWRVAIASDNLEAAIDLPYALVRYWSEQGWQALPPSLQKQAVDARIRSLHVPLTTRPVLPSLSTAGPVTPITLPPLSDPPAFAASLIPAMRIDLQELWRQGKNLGRLSAEVQPFAQGVRFVNLQGQINSMDVRGQLEWQWLPNQTVSINQAQVAHNTRFAGQLSTQTMPAFLSAWGYPPVIDAKSAQLNAEVQWPGNPLDWALARLTGKADLQMAPGRLLTVDTTTSSVRVVGLMNFETLIRRMQLDFSDLFNKGLAFDEIKGNFVLANQQMHTDNFVIKGPAATFKVSGNADLLQRQLDHELIATLPVSRNLVLPAAATGGLPAAATAFLIEQALGDRLDKLTELKFSLRGSWQDPKIEKR